MEFVKDSRWFDIVPASSSIPWLDSPQGQGMFSSPRSDELRHPVLDLMETVVSLWNKKMFAHLRPLSRLIPGPLSPHATIFLRHDT
jgi:hypothetical protein